MANVLVSEQNLTNIADAIRDKGVSGKFTPAEMSEAIGNIETGRVQDVKVNGSSVMDASGVANIRLTDFGVSVLASEINYVQDVSSNIQTQLNSKITANESITGASKAKITYDAKGLVTGGEDLIAADIPNLAADKITSGTFDSARIPDLTLSKISDVSATTSEVNKLAGLATTATELGYVNGVTSNIQTQLNGKEAADATILKKANVVDDVISVTTDAPLSANQGKLLNDRINNLESIGRFLSVWNCTTGLPTSDPQTTPYTYRTGDYYRVGVVSTDSEGINYKPVGTTYNKVASTTVETEKVDIGYIYYFDGTSWGLQAGSPEGKVQDVQVDGVTILSDGIANLTGSNAPEIDASKVTSGTFADARIASASTWNAKQEAITSSTDLSVKTLTGGITYLTTAPTENNTDGVKIVVLSSDPDTKYNGYLYIITE